MALARQRGREVGMAEEHENERQREAARAWLRAECAALDGRGGPERRHETLMERAEGWGLPRTDAEQAYALAEESGLEPELGLLLRISGVGVTELEPVDALRPDPGQQQAPPEWVEAADVAPEEAQRERRLRLSFRRMAGLLAGSRSAVEAVARFLAEPDVIEGAY